MTVEVLYFEGCPHADGAHALVQSCVSELGIDATVIKREADYPSPTVRVDGRDVMGEPAASLRACRLDVPTRDRILAALRRAVGGGTT